MPAVTEEEVAQSINSRGKKMVPVSPPVGTTGFEFKTILGVAYMLYMRDRKLPTPEAVSHNVPTPLQVVDTIMASPQFRHAMLIRGIDFSGQTRLSAEQDMAIAIMATPDGKPFEQRLRKAGVAPSKWRAWLRNPAFREVWDAVGGSVLKDFESDILTALTGQALNGNVRAIEYALEVSGRHNPARQQNVDATLVMAQFIEIVQEEVKDTAVLARIAARMQMVAGTPAAQGVVASARQALTQGDE